MRSYFDHNSSTPLHPCVLKTLTGLLADVYGNPSSVHHVGQIARQRLEAARRSVAALVGAAPREIVFTSGGTESDNLAIFGVVRASSKPRKHVITSAIEHPAVLAACAELAREGVSVTFLPAGESGVVDSEDVRLALRPETVLVSVMHANNETGAIQPVQEIAKIAREAGVPLHCDGVQACGRIPVDVRALDVDLYSLSGHKMNAPKGAGALFVRDRTRLHPRQYGGHQERDRRAGTENVPACVAFGEAAEIAIGQIPDSALRDRLESGILQRVPEATVNAEGGPRLPNTSNIRFAGITGEALVIALDLAGFAVSSGAACSSGSIEPSHVLLAMGMGDPAARASVRFSLGLGNDAEQVDRLIEAVAEVVARGNHSRARALHRAAGEVQHA